MREIFGSKSTITTGIVIVLSCLISQSARADSTSSFALPGVSLPQGTDEVRAADGTSCRSAVGGNGAYLDMGAIGNPSDNMKTSSVYGHVVIPLGRSPKRLDCTQLYQLEVERLKMELELAKAGLGRAQDPEMDNTETSSTSNEDAGQQDAPVEDVVAEQAVPDVAPAPALKTKSSKKKGKASAPAAQTLDAQAAALDQGEAPVPAKKKKVAYADGTPKAAKGKKKKIGNAGWADDGWSDAGMKDGS
jgi:hypothetical protein